MTVSVMAVCETLGKGKGKHGFV